MSAPKVWTKKCEGCGCTLALIGPNACSKRCEDAVWDYLEQTARSIASLRRP